MRAAFHKCKDKGILTLSYKPIIVVLLSKKNKISCCSMWRGEGFTSCTKEFSLQRLQQWYSDSFKVSKNHFYPHILVDLSSMTTFIWNY